MFPINREENCTPSPFPSQPYYTLVSMALPPRRASLLLTISIIVTLVYASHGGHAAHSSFSVPLDDKAGGQPTVKLYHQVGRRRTGRGKPVPLQTAGSRLPDCSHACGSCSPCRLVMVSFVCASLQEAETCPMAYKCMCNGKSYPVP